MCAFESCFDALNAGPRCIDDCPCIFIKCLKNISKTTTTKIHTKHINTWQKPVNPMSSRKLLKLLTVSCFPSGISSLVKVWKTQIEVVCKTSPQNKPKNKLYLVKQNIWKGSFHSSTCSIWARWLLAVSRQPLSSLFLGWRSRLQSTKYIFLLPPTNQFWNSTALENIAAEGGIRQSWACWPPWSLSSFWKMRLCPGTTA